MLFLKKRVFAKKKKYLVRDTEKKIKIKRELCKFAMKIANKETRIQNRILSVPILLGDPEVAANFTSNHATFPIRIRKITVQICGNFWVTQYN